MTIRQIKKEDNKLISDIIKSVMTEFRADPHSTVLGEDSINMMYEYYQFPKAIYFVAEDDGQIAGGSGIKQLDRTDENLCELQRMFLLPSSRGKGIGKALIELCIQKAKEFGYDQIYLESLSQMKDARKLYGKSGFRIIDHPKGNTGHGGCNVFMVLDL